MAGFLFEVEAGDWHHVAVDTEKYQAAKMSAGCRTLGQLVLL
jgi:hypothetical protein